MQSCCVRKLDLGSKFQTGVIFAQYSSVFDYKIILMCII